jgi:hypothetical protein
MILLACMNDTESTRGIGPNSVLHVGRQPQTVRDINTRKMRLNSHFQQFSTGCGDYMKHINSSSPRRQRSVRQCSRMTGCASVTHVTTLIFKLLNMVCLLASSYNVRPSTATTEARSTKFILVKFFVSVPARSLNCFLQFA